MIQTADKFRLKASSTRLYQDRQRKSMILKGQNDGNKYRRTKDEYDRFDSRHEKNDRSDNISYKRPKRDSVPQLVINLHDPRHDAPQFSGIFNGQTTGLSSSSKKHRDTISEKIMQPNISNPLSSDVSYKKTTSSYKNMNLKTKHCQHLMEDIDNLKAENQSLREENIQLRRKLLNLEQTKNIYQITSQQNISLKKQAADIKQQNRVLEERFQKLLIEHHEVVEKARSLYEQLIKQKKKHQQIKNFLLNIEKPSMFEQPVYSRQSIYKNSYERYQHQGKEDYYSNAREAERQRLRKQYMYSHAYN